MFRPVRMIGYMNFVRPLDANIFDIRPLKKPEPVESRARRWMTSGPAMTSPLVTSAISWLRSMPFART